MTNARILIIALALLLCASQTLAAEFKYGVLDIAAVLQKSEPGQAAFKELKDKFDGMKADLDKRKTEIEKLRADMEKQNLVLSQEAKTEKELEMKRKVRDFQDMFQVYQTKMKAEEERRSKPISDMLSKVVKEYGEKNGFSAIVDSRSGVLYFDEALDVTNQVTLELNRAWREKK